MILLVCGILKKGKNELIYKTEIEVQLQKINLQLPGGRRECWKIGIDIYTLLYIKLITNKDQLYRIAGQPFQHRECYSILCNGIYGRRIRERVDICICVTYSLSCPSETNTRLYINSTPIKIIILCIYFWLCLVLIPMWAFLELWQAGASLQLGYVGFSLQWLLWLQSRGSRVWGLQQLRLPGSRTQAQSLWHTGLVALQYGDLPRPGIESMSSVLLAGRFLTTESPGKPYSLKN